MRTLLKFASTFLFSLSLALAMIGGAARETQADDDGLLPKVFCPAACPAQACGLFQKRSCFQTWYVDANGNPDFQCDCI